MMWKGLAGIVFRGKFLCSAKLQRVSNV